jgi:hypothetical protein
MFILPHKATLVKIHSLQSSHQDQAVQRYMDGFTQKESSPSPEILPASDIILITGISRLMSFILKAQ